jgi:tripartite-type tricarboxylate transporter receptor subunit TctC
MGRSVLGAPVGPPAPSQQRWERNVNRPVQLLALLVSIGQALCLTARADEYPSRMITLVVPFPAGGAADTVARLIAPRLGTRLGQTVVVENKPGATGIIGMQSVARSAPDGYTLGIASSGSHGALPNVQRSLPFDPIKDFTPMGFGASFPLVMVIPSSIKPTTLKDFIDYARSRKSELTYGSSGPGGTLHIAGEMFRLATGIPTLHVPFRGESLALVEVIADRVVMAFPAAGGAIGQIKGGTLRALAVTGPKRLPILPDVPTMTEAGLPGFEIGVWYGVAGPAGVPADITRKISDAIRQVVQEPDFIAKIQDQGGEVSPMGPDEFSAYIRRQIESIGRVTKAANITLD